MVLYRIYVTGFCGDEKFSGRKNSIFFQSNLFPQPVLDKKWQ